jgi:hypothetical protein
MMKRIALSIVLLLSCVSMACAQGGTMPGPWRGSGGGAPAGISDDFSSDTSANYTSVNGHGIVVSGGVATGADPWYVSVVYHETSTGSNNHQEAALLSVDAGLLIRSNGTTGYVIKRKDATNIELYSINGATLTYVAVWPHASIATPILVRASISGSTITISADLNGNSDFGDAGEVLSPTGDGSLYSAGGYVGAYLSCGATCASTVDNLSGAAL